jgi:DNA modification methylase
MNVNSIITGDSAEVLKTFDADCIDLTVTSPPYDNLRTYNGFVFDFETIARELYRVTKPGGVVVWVVGDATINGSETGTSFRQALYFMECGFNLHDTMIYQSPGTGAKGSNLAYWQCFEYMFLFSKGTPKSVNRLKDKRNKKVGTVCTSGAKQAQTGTRLHPAGGTVVQEYGYRDNVWVVLSGNNGDDQTDHPAPFPEALARDHILSWSNPGDLVLDCFAGSGTTLKAAKQLKRDYIGIEISAEYVTIAEKRLLATTPALFA